MISIKPSFLNLVLFSFHTYYDIATIFLSYRDQFALLAEGIARERYEMEVREKAQEKVSYRPDLLFEVLMI